MIEKNLNKETLKDFISWYKYKLSINDFFKLSNELKLGIYLKYIQDKQFYIVPTNKGSLIINDNLTIIDVIKYDSKSDIINVFYDSIIKVFELISNPL